MIKLKVLVQSLYHVGLIPTKMQNKFFKAEIFLPQILIE